jgi:hypothetical protein
MIRRALLSLAFGALGVILGSAPRAAWAAQDPVAIDQAQGLLKQLATHLGDKKIQNEDLLADLDLVFQAYHNLKKPEGPPAEPAADASEEVKKKYAEDKKKYDADMAAYPGHVKDFQNKADDLLLKAMLLTKVPPRGTDNARNDVNIKAAQVLGDLLAYDATKEPDMAKGTDEQKKEVRDREKQRAGIAKKLQAALGKDLYKPGWQVPTGLTEAAFGALGKMNDAASLTWLMENFVHTRNVPEDEEQLIAAHKAMKLFKNVPAKQRYAIVDAFMKIYPSTEAQAEKSDKDPKIQAAKRFWDRIKTDAVAVVAYYASSPSNDKGEALSTMQEFAGWFRTHDKPNRPPWVDEK